MILSAMDQTIANTAIKGLESSFHSFSEIGWVTSAFMLSSSVFALQWGRFGMLFGRRLCLLLSIFLFELGSLISAVAPSMNAFIAGRVITGIGAAGIQTGAMIVISEISPVSKRGILFAGVTLSIVPATVIGPLIGGAFTSSKTLTWRWCLYINLPFGGLAGLCLLLFYHPLPPKNFLAHIKWKKWPECIIEFSKTVDFGGTVLLTASWVLLLVGISLGDNKNSWRSAIVLTFVILGGILFIFGLVFDFCVFDRTHGHNIPLLPREWIVILGVLGPAFALFFGSWSFMPF
jgi:MFS family permease